MRKWMVLCLVMLSLCTLVFGNAEQVLPENKKDFSDLLSCLLSAVETPEKWSEPQLDAILLRIRNGSEEDTYLAESITSVWKKLYIDPGYELNLYPATDAGKALSEGGVSDTPTHAFAVLGYALENGKMTAELMGRCDAAAAAARAFPQTRLICSGGATGANNPKHHTEAGRMKEYLTEVCGIAPERILVDESAMTTAENAMNTYAIMQENGIRTLTVVTSSYHQKWGEVLYHAAGILTQLQSGYETEILGTYSFETEPSKKVFRNDARIAISQLADMLHVPIKGLSRK